MWYNDQNRTERAKSLCCIMLCYKVCVSFKHYNNDYIFCSLSLRHSVISEVDDQSDMSYYVSMAPDSLEVPLNKDMEGNM
jgi:hypothetical protein